MHLASFPLGLIPIMMIHSCGVTRVFLTLNRWCGKELDDYTHSHENINETFQTPDFHGNVMQHSVDLFMIQLELEWLSLGILSVFGDGSINM
jgi:hypothetical protein